MNVVWTEVCISTGERQALCGIRGVIVERFEMTMAGYDVLVSCDAAEVAAAYAAESKCTAQEILDGFAFQDWLKGDRVLLEANSESEVVAV